MSLVQMVCTPKHPKQPQGSRSCTKQQELPVKHKVLEPPSKTNNVCGFQELFPGSDIPLFWSLEDRNDFTWLMF